jgi:hypothetical protein
MPAYDFRVVVSGEVHAESVDGAAAAVAYAYTAEDEEDSPLTPLRLSIEVNE